MNAREFVNKAQRGLIANEYLSSKLPAIFSTNPKQLAELILNYKYTAQQPVNLPVDYSKIRKVALAFHEKADTLTSAVKQNIENLGTGSPLLRIAHTPDHFAYLGVYSQFIYLDLVSRFIAENSSFTPTQVLVLVDYESVDDKRLRQSYFPDIEYSGGALHISSSVSLSLHFKSQNVIPKPDKKIVEGWLISISHIIKHNLAVLRRSGYELQNSSIIRERFELISHEVWLSFARADTLSDFNAIFMSRILNLIWGLNVAIIPLSQITSVFAPVYEYLLTMYPEMVEASKSVIHKLEREGIQVKNNLLLKPNVLPLWYLCSACNARVHLQTTINSKLFIQAQCPGCHKQYKFDLGSFSQPDLSEIQDHMAPKVIFDEITDVIGWKMHGGMSYDGSSEHVITNSLIAQELGFVTPPECLWRPRGVYFGLAEIRAIQKMQYANNENLDKVMSSLKRTYWGRCSILYFILSQGVSGLYEMWTKHFEEGNQLFELNIGNNPFLLSDDQISVLINTVRQFES